MKLKKQIVSLKGQKKFPYERYSLYQRFRGSVADVDKYFVEHYSEYFLYKLDRLMYEQLVFLRVTSNNMDFTSGQK